MMPLPPGMQVFERGWLSANNILFTGSGTTTLVDTGYVTHAPQTLALDGWQATVSFREFQFGERAWLKDQNDYPDGSAAPNGGVAIAQTGPNEFVLVGQRARIKLSGAGANAGKMTMLVRAEEGRFDGAGKWIMARNWNGDQTDYGLNLPAEPTVLKLTMGSVEQ